MDGDADSASTEWVQEAAPRVLALLDEHSAVYQQELIARLNPEAGPYWDSGHAIEPTVVSETVNALVGAGLIRRVHNRTRGGRSVPMLIPANTRGRATRIDRAVARKSLLVARYDSWAQASSRFPRGRLGPAGETAALASIRESHCMVEGPDTQERTGLGGYRFSGPVDWMGTTLSLSQGRVAVVVVEVKNVRSWIYPHSQEVYQLLSKAAGLQRHSPHLDIVPVLVCRRANRRMFAMAHHLGFFVVEAEQQPTGLSEDEEGYLTEVRQELGYQDLRRGKEPIPKVTRGFAAVHENWPRFADRWRTLTGEPEAVAAIHALAERGLPGPTRTSLKHELGRRALHVQGTPKFEWWDR